MDSRQTGSLSIPLVRCNNYWRWYRICSRLFAAWLLFAFSCVMIYLAWDYDLLTRDVPMIEYIEPFSLNLSHFCRRPLFLLIFGFAIAAAFSCLFRRRYLTIDQMHGLVHYDMVILGRRTFYFVEVCAVQLETDMSKALLKLKSDKLYRIYLKLHNGKSLLIQEQPDMEKTDALVAQLRDIFSVEVEQLHRVGNKQQEKVTLGNYVLDKELSHGGMGKVFLAYPKNSETKVALKILPASLALSNSNYVSSFARETRILQKLSHPNIVRVFHVGRETGPGGQDVYYYAMQYIEGEPLSKMIAADTLTTHQSAEFIMQIALALDYIHKHKVIHRDVKSSNIMICNDGEENYAVLIDFGIARDISRLSTSTDGNGFQTDVSHYVGTLPYMSPEQLSSTKTIDHRTDIFSLGVTFYEMLTGQRPFRGSDQSIYRSILAWHPPEPSRVNKEVAKELDIICTKAMEKDKVRRYQSGAAMAEDIHLWMQGKPIRNKPVGWFTRTWRRIRGFFRWL